MNKEQFDTIAREFDIDVYGDIFGECSYGIYFSFDLVTALYVYAMEDMDFYKGSELRHALESAPILFRMSPIFSYADFLNTDINAEYGDYTTSKMIYDAIVDNPDTMQTYLDALLWYCTEMDKAYKE